MGTTTTTQEAILLRTSFSKASRLGFDTLAASEINQSQQTQKCELLDIDGSNPPG